MMVSSTTTKSSKITFNNLGSAQKCKICDASIRMHGPIWNGTLHDKNFIQKLLTNKLLDSLKTKSRIIGILNVMSEELENPLYMALPEMSSTIHSVTPPLNEFK